MQRQDVGLLEQRLPARRNGDVVGARLGERRLAPPREDLHAESLAVSGDHGADAAVAVDAERAPAQRGPDARLPAALFQRRDFLRNPAQRADHQSPGELRGPVGRARCLPGRYDHAAPGAGTDIDMRARPVLADDLQLGQFLDERRRNRRALAEQDQGFGVLETRGERLDLLGVVVPHLDRVAGEPGKARQGRHYLLVIVQDRYIHSARAAGRRNLRNTGAFPAGAIYHFTRPSARTGFCHALCRGHSSALDVADSRHSKGRRISVLASPARGPSPQGDKSARPPHPRNALTV